MNENLRSIIPSDPIETSSVITGPKSSSTDLVELQDQIATKTPSDNQMAESSFFLESMAESSLSTKWTDEKHRLYLSSMEASFVKQLHSHEYRSLNMFDWSSRGRTILDPSARGPSSGQFKVLQSGHWKQLNFDRPQPQVDVVDESPALLENHWIKRFRPAGRRHREVTSPKMEENGSPCDDLDDEAVHSGGNKTATAAITTTVVATSPMQFSNCHSHLYHNKDSVGSSTEVSDQNFPIEDHKGEQLSSFSRAKRMKTKSVDDSTGVNDSNKDQVVPT